MAKNKRQHRSLGDSIIVVSTYGERPKQPWPVRHRDFLSPEQAGQFFANRKRERVASAILYRDKSATSYAVDYVCEPSNCWVPISSGGHPGLGRRR